MSKVSLVIIAFLISFHCIGQDKFHFVFFGKTDDLDIGEEVSADSLLVDSLFNYIQREADIKEVITHFYTGEKYDANHLQTFIDTLSISPTDRVFMIIDNHGARFRGQYSSFPMIQFPIRGSPFNNDYSYVSLKGVHDQLVKKGAQFVFTIGVMCNNYLDLMPNTKQEQKAKNMLQVDNPFRSLVKQNFSYMTDFDSLSNLLKLFHFGKGQILMNTADRDQLTFYNDQSGNEQFGSLALHSIFENFLAIKGQRDTSTPPEIASCLLKNIRDSYGDKQLNYRQGKRRNRRNQEVPRSKIIYKAQINDLTFNHTDSCLQSPTVAPDVPPPVAHKPICTDQEIKRRIVSKSKDLVKDLLRDLQLKYQGIPTSQDDFFDKFLDKGKDIKIGLVLGLNNQTTKRVPVKDYYQRYITNNQKYAKVQVSLKDTSSVWVQSGPFLGNGRDVGGDPNIVRHEILMNFTQVFIGITKSNCIGYKDETTKTATIHIFTNAETCQFQKAYIVDIDTKDGNIECLPDQEIVAYDDRSKKERTYRECIGTGCQ